MHKIVGFLAMSATGDKTVVAYKPYDPSKHLPDISIRGSVKTTVISAG